VVGGMTGKMVEGGGNARLDGALIGKDTYARAWGSAGGWTLQLLALVAGVALILLLVRALRLRKWRTRCQAAMEMSRH